MSTVAHIMAGSCYYLIIQYLIVKDAILIYWIDKC